MTYLGVNFRFNQKQEKNYSFKILHGQAIVMKARKCVWKAKESIKKGSESNILCTHYFLHFVLQKEDPKDKFEKNKRQTKGFK